MTIYKDPTRPVAERVADLLARMTPEEKFAQMHAYWLVLSPDGDHRERTDLSDEFSGVTQQAVLRGGGPGGAAETRRGADNAPARHAHRRTA